MIHLEEEPTEQEMKHIQKIEAKLRRHHLTVGMSISADAWAGDGDSAPAAKVQPSAGGYNLIKKRPAGARRKELEAEAKARWRAAKSEAKLKAKAKPKGKAKPKVKQQSNAGSCSGDLLQE